MQPMASTAFKIAPARWTCQLPLAWVLWDRCGQRELGPGGCWRGLHW